jgi:hypothetical protein
MTVKITLTIDDKVADAIAAAFDRDDREKVDREKVAQSFAQIALFQFHDWIVGARRYRSLTEQYTAWVEELYEALLPPTEGPSVHRLYNSFNMPHGQATYIARILSEKLLKKWRQQALIDLKADIDRAWPAADKFVKKNEGERPVVLHTSKLAALELQRLSDEIWRTDKTFVAPTSKGSLGDQRTLEVPAASLQMLREKLKATR